MTFSLLPDCLAARLLGSLHEVEQVVVAVELSTSIAAAARLRPDELNIRLGHLFEMHGIGLVTGEAGSGKTSATRRTVSALHTGLYKVLYVCQSTGNVMDLYKSNDWELGLPSERNRTSLFRQIKNEVNRLSIESRCKPILIIDEAHNLRTDVLEDLRLLTNYQMDAENRLCLLFIGQAELHRRLSMAAYESLSQRIVVRYHVASLLRAELGQYLSHHLLRAGTKLPIFEPAAEEALFQETQALPRMVNSLAHHALMAAAVAKSKSVNPHNHSERRRRQSP
ncbi:MAG: AAA family ATPase [Deltaproteobacteria bacterium]|nr:AAA family ATPase [Deltaproteobacteria bacterium]